MLDNQLIACPKRSKTMKSETKLPEIVEPPCWKVSPVDLSDFFRQLSKLVPDNSVLCLEGVDTPEIEAYLQNHPASYENETNQGFLKMRAKIFYMTITEEFLQNFAFLTEKYAEPEICSHLRVYRNDKIILSWHDLPSDPFYVSEEVDESVLKNFCSSFGCGYVIETI